MIEKITSCVNASKNYAYTKASSIYELVLICIEKVNEVIDFVNGFQAEIDSKEDSSNITGNRKLSANGDFTGTLCGKKTACQIPDEIDDNRDQIQFIASQFADGQTGLVIDGGFFEETGIARNYNGGYF